MQRKDMPNSFFREGLGSATEMNLDGKSEQGGYVTEQGVKQSKDIAGLSDDYSTRGAPWDRGPSLVEMTQEVGVEFNAFIEGLDKGRSDMEMAQELGVKEKTINHLRNHFFKYGINSVEGQD